MEMGVEKKSNIGKKFICLAPPTQSHTEINSITILYRDSAYSLMRNQNN